jgi:heat shock protein HslJ
MVDRNTCCGLQRLSDNRASRSGLLSPAKKVPDTISAFLLTHIAGGWRALRIAILCGIIGITRAAVAVELPAGLHSPDHGVVCDSRRAVCFDRFGPSIGLTEAFLGPDAARALTAALHKTGPDHSPGAHFSPGDNIVCRRETGPCRVGEIVHEALTAALYGPHPPRSRSAEAAAVIGVDWQWVASRYNNDTEARPADPGRYWLRLEPDGSLRARVDCNQAGGRYRMSDGAIVIEVMHSTMAACEPGSLDRIFLRDLSGAAIYFMRQGRLYLDLKYDTGTMEFGR